MLSLPSWRASASSSLCLSPSLWAQEESCQQWVSLPVNPRRGCFPQGQMNRNMHTTTVPAVQASSVDLTPTAFLTLRKRRPWVSKNILCTGLSREHSGFLMGGEESLSVSLGICPEDKMSKTGLGYRRHSAGWQKAVCGILDTHLMMYCHWLQPSPFGKRALDRLLFFSLALMCTVP